MLVRNRARARPVWGSRAEANAVGTSSPEPGKRPHMVSALEILSLFMPTFNAFRLIYTRALFVFQMVLLILILCRS